VFNNCPYAKKLDLSVAYLSEVDVDRPEDLPVWEEQMRDWKRAGVEFEPRTLPQSLTFADQQNHLNGQQ